MVTSLPSTMEALRQRGIPIATLSTISLAKLNNGDVAELEVLEKAASHDGFFYLDMRCGRTKKSVLDYLETIYGLAENYFKQPVEAKSADVRHDIKPSQDLGYKHGRGPESFELSREEVKRHGPSLPQLPQLFKDEWEALSEFIVGCDHACTTILRCLSPDFTAHHRVDQPSDTGLKLVSAPSLDKISDVPENLHTDSGTLTLLFYKEWGLHAFIRGAGMWGFIPPVEGCAVVNVGNALQMFSHLKYHSPEHRVTQPLNSVGDRYYLSFFLRPETATEARWKRDL